MPKGCRKRSGRQLRAECDPSTSLIERFWHTSSISDNRCDIPANCAECLSDSIASPIARRQKDLRARAHATQRPPRTRGQTERTWQQSPRQSFLSCHFGGRSPSAAILGPAARKSKGARFSSRARCEKNRTAFWLVNAIQSNERSRESAESSGVQSSGGSKSIHGRTVTSAPFSFRARKKVGACSGARVMTMRFPASGFSALANGSSREAQNFVRACARSRISPQCASLLRRDPPRSRAIRAGQIHGRRPKKRAASM